MFDLSKLFERRRTYFAGPYPTLAAELDAVRARKKGISMFQMTRSGIVRDDAFFIELVKAAFDRGLTVMLTPDARHELPDSHRPVHAFVLHPDQAWRVPAHLALFETMFEGTGWSPNNEAQQGLLLGYTAKQRAEWRKHLSLVSAGYGGPTIYTLLTRDQRRRVVELGKRCFGPASALVGMTFFDHTQRHRPARAAASRVPANHTLARVVVRGAAYRALFAPAKFYSKPHVVTATVTKQLATTLAAALRSDVQLLTRRGWT